MRLTSHTAKLWLQVKKNGYIHKKTEIIEVDYYALFPTERYEYQDIMYLNYRHLTHAI